MNAGHPKSVLYSYTKDVMCWESDFLVTKDSLSTCISVDEYKTVFGCPNSLFTKSITFCVHDISAWGSSYPNGFQPFLLYSWVHGSSLHFLVSLMPGPDALHPSITKTNVPTSSKLIYFDSTLNVTLARNNEVIHVGSCN